MDEDNCETALSDEQLLLLMFGTYFNLYAQSALLLTKIKAKRRLWVKDIFKHRTSKGLFHHLVLEMELGDRESYKMFFRMPPAILEKLLKLLGGLLTKQTTFFRYPISPKERLCMTLRYLASGDSMSSMSFSFRIGYSTVSGIVQETCQAIWQVLSASYISLPKGDDWKDIANDFWTRWQLPNCVGALDGKHIAIQAPKHEGSLYYNYKGFHSKVLMAMCDARYRFTMIDVGAPGRQNDSGTFAASPFGIMLNAGHNPFPPETTLPNSDKITPHFIVADGAFPLKTYIMKPYPGNNLPMPASIFNFRLCRARNRIENAFGILANRWRIFKSEINAKLSTIDDIIKACCALHNFLLVENRHDYAPAGFTDMEGFQGGIIPGTWRNNENQLVPVHQAGSNNYTKTAQEIREILTMYFISSEGEYEHQYRNILCE